eukprot:scaffold2028_cov181-Ochromonas_danica.AAC.18
MEGYTTCLNQCNIIVNNLTNSKNKSTPSPSTSSAPTPATAATGGSNTTSTGAGGSTSATPEADNTHKIVFLKEIRGEILLRMAVLKKEMGELDNAMHLCNIISGELHGESIKLNALCLKGLLHEIKGEFPSSEVVYRSVLQSLPGHAIALERLGRVYLRYRETIPAAVQCFFKAVETNPSNHVAWYLLGRCYMATSQYTDAWEAYNRAVNLNPNDPQVWCSLGVLYYAFGQYKEALGMLARALKLDPTLADAWYNVGALYDMCDQPDDAQQAYLKARENGLADRFARAGMALNPLAIQAVQSFPIGAAPGSAINTSSSQQSAMVGGGQNFQQSHSHSSGQLQHSGGNGMGGPSPRSTISLNNGYAMPNVVIDPNSHHAPSYIQLPNPNNGNGYNHMGPTMVSRGGSMAEGITGGNH